MSFVGAPDIEMDFPLSWIDGRPRTPAGARKEALWAIGGRRLSLAAGA